MSSFKEDYNNFVDIENKKLAKEKSKKLHELGNNYAIYKIGQILDDGVKRIDVTAITGSISVGIPCVVYKGVLLTKQNKPKKSGGIGYIYADQDQKNITVINKRR